MKKYSKRAFTILELLVTIAIIAIIAVVVVPNFTGAIDRSKAAREIAEINSVTKAVSTFYTEHGYYPTLQGDQPTPGNPKNVKFSSIYPDYLVSLPHFSYWWVDHTGRVAHTKSSIASIEDDVLTIANSSKQPVTYRAITKNSDGTVNTQTYTSGTISLSPNTIVEVISDKTGEVILTLNSSFTAPLMDPNDPDYGAEAPNAVLTIDPSTGADSNTEIAFDSSDSTTDGKLSVASRQWSLDNELLPSTDKTLKQIISEPGEHTIGLRIQDSAGTWSNWVYKTFSIAQANRAPIAVITMSPSSNITNRTNIEFTSASTDPDIGDNIQEEKWYTEDLLGWLFGQSTAPNGTYSVGTHTIRLKVKDSHGTWSDETSITFDVIEANHAPVAAITMTPSTGITSETTVTFSSSSTDQDSWDTITEEQWNIDGSLFNQSVAPVQTFSIGTHTVTLKVKDSSNTWSDNKASITFNVTKANHAPVASFTMSQTAGITNETTILFTNTSSDPDGDITTRKWYVDGVLKTTEPNGTFTVGTHSVYLVVTDPAGLSSTSSTVTFTVTKLNHAPVAVISVTPNTAIYNDTNLTWSYASSTDADGDAIAGAEWQLDSNSIVTSAPNGLLPAGNHTMKLRVKDAVGAWSQWVSTDITVDSLLNTVLSTVDTTKWKRYDDTNAGITYIGSTWTAAAGATGNYNSTVHTVLSNPAPVTNRIDFTFSGTKLRVIGTQNFDFTTDLALYIDGTQVQVNSVKTVAGTTRQVLNLEVYGLSSGEHRASIHAVSDASRWNLDAIDVDSNGYLVTPVEGNYLSGGYVSLMSAYGLYDANSMGKFTLEAWVRRPSIPSSGIAEIMATSEGGGYELFVNNYGYLYMSLYIGGGYKYVGSSAAMPANQWVHVASTFDGQYMRMYVNGVLNNTVSVTGSINSGTYLALGANPPDMSSGWGGDLSNVRVWKVARTAQQIKDSMYGWLSGSETGLIGYWKLNEASGTVAHDSSPSGKNGAVVSGTWKQ